MFWYVEQKFKTRFLANFKLLFAGFRLLDVNWIAGCKCKKVQDQVMFSLFYRTNKHLSLKLRQICRVRQHFIKEGRLSKAVGVIVEVNVRKQSLHAALQDSRCLNTYFMFIG